jgi:hypothetical protein
MTQEEKIQQLEQRVSDLEALFVERKGMTDAEQFARQVGQEMRRDPDAWRAKMKGKSL